MVRPCYTNVRLHGTFRIFELLHYPPIRSCRPRMTQKFISLGRIGSRIEAQQKVHILEHKSCHLNKANSTLQLTHIRFIHYIIGSFFFIITYMSLYTLHESISTKSPYKLDTYYFDKTHHIKIHSITQNKQK